MMGPAAVSPLLYDTSDYMIMVGLGIAHGARILDFNTGYAYAEDRLVTPADQVNFPGRYQLETPLGLTVGATYGFGSEAT